MTHADEPEARRPAWWRANERTKEELGLSPYVPPRFRDDVYTHEVVDPLEAEYGCRIMFVGVHVRHEDDWQVRIDGAEAFEIGRSRDDNGNTVYHLTAEEFEAAVREELASR